MNIDEMKDRIEQAEEIQRYTENRCEALEQENSDKDEWHFVKDGDLPRQDGHTCFSIEVLAGNKKWVYYRFDFGKWFCGNNEVKVIAWKEIVLPELKECK